MHKLHCLLWGVFQLILLVLWSQICELQIHRARHQMTDSRDNSEHSGALTKTELKGELIFNMYPDAALFANSREHTGDGSYPDSAPLLFSNHT